MDKQYKDDLVLGALVALLEEKGIQDKPVPVVIDEIKRNYENHVHIDLNGFSDDMEGFLTELADAIMNLEISKKYRVRKIEIVYQNESNRYELESEYSDGYKYSEKNNLDKDKQRYLNIKIEKGKSPSKTSQLIDYYFNKERFEKEAIPIVTKYIATMKEITRLSDPAFIETSANKKLLKMNYYDHFVENAPYLEQMYELLKTNKVDAYKEVIPLEIEDKGKVFEYRLPEVYYGFYESGQKDPFFKISSQENIKDSYERLLKTVEKA